LSFRQALKRAIKAGTAGALAAGGVLLALVPSRVIKLMPHHTELSLSTRQAPERAIKAHVAGALAAGGVLREQEPIVSWAPTADGGVRVKTEKGEYKARKLVLTAGSWMPQLVPGLQVKLSCQGVEYGKRQ